MAFQSSVLRSASLMSNSISPTILSVSDNISTIPENETIIEVDSNLRIINVPTSMKNIAVSGDHVSETVYFKVPRYFDNKDLSEHDCIVRIINAGNEYTECKAINVELNDDHIRFGWLLTNYVTRYAGEISFSIQFETVQDGVKYQWQTQPAKLNILSGINVESTITDKDDSLFRNLSKRVDSIENDIDTKNQTVNNLEATVSSLLDRVNELERKVGFLENNVVYILNET